jgi:2-amino-4-hydroxy-6-hydroxymethyldihydropteridine diphosphokinase
VALGSNLGDKEDNLRRAILEMISQKTISVIEMSSVYETEPMYYENQDLFLNCVIAVKTDLRPRELLERLQGIELEMGRQRNVKYGPRVIDLDILFYGDEIVSEPGIEIPHPRLAERPFVLIPLNEIRPKLIHPVLGKSVSELLASLKVDEQVVKRPSLLADLASSLLPPRS